MEPQPNPPFAVPPSLTPYLSPPQTLTNLPVPIDAFIASTFVFSSSRLLLIQRSATDGWPLMWEIPGGGVDPTDPSVLHAAARELAEEAGLALTSFLACVDDYGAGEPPHIWRDDNPDKGWMWCRLSFVVEVESSETVTLDEREHQDYVWATEEEVMAGRAGGRELKFVSPGMKQILLAGFRAKQEVDRRAEAEKV